METTKPKLLCVDDESDNLDALERLFRKKYEVLKATSAAKAFEILDNCPDIAVIISDQRMPVISGVEFLEKSIASHINTSRILLTGYTDIESVIAAVNKGQIFRYLTKPWDAADLTNTTDQALEKYLLKTELKEKNNELQKALDELKSLDKAKNQFMILINHELKTPLTTILSFAGLLKETLL
ncbi:MAG: response regulator, partial [Pseudobdellovibrio sp.]